jgi:hypothetical protein
MEPLRSAVYLKSNVKIHASSTLLTTHAQKPHDTRSLPDTVLLSHFNGATMTTTTTHTDAQRHPKTPSLAFYCSASYHSSESNAHRMTRFAWHMQGKADARLRRLDNGLEPRRRRHLNKVSNKTPNPLKTRHTALYPPAPGGPDGGGGGGAAEGGGGGGGAASVGGGGGAEAEAPGAAAAAPP